MWCRECERNAEKKRRGGERARGQGRALVVSTRCRSGARGRSPLGRRRHPRETQRVAPPRFARSGRASRTCCGTFAQPWLITLDSQTTRDGGTRVPPRSCASRSAGDEARRDRVATVFYRPSRTARGRPALFLCSRARASAAKRIQRICTLRLNAYTRSIFVFSPRDPARVEGSDLRRAAQCARAGSATGSCRPLDSERRSRAGHRSTGAHSSVCLEGVVRDARAEKWRCAPRSPGWRRARA